MEIRKLEFNVPKGDSETAAMNVIIELFHQLDLSEDQQMRVLNYMKLKVTDKKH